MRSICVFGDSLAKGVTLDPVKKRYVFLKDSFVSLAEKKTGVKIANYSKFGCDITRGESILLSHTEEIKNYDYTLIEFGGNDCNFDWKSVSDAPEQAHEPLTPLKKFAGLYLKMIDTIKKVGAKPVAVTLPPLDSKKFFGWVSKGNSASNILKWLGDVEHIYRWHKEYNDCVLSCAKSAGIPVLDLRSVFTNLTDYSKYLCDDGMHLNEEGHILASNKLCEFCLN